MLKYITTLEMSSYMIIEFKFKFIVLFFCTLLLLNGCNYSDECTSEKLCQNRIESSINEDHPQKALSFYKKYTQYSKKQNIYLLNLIATKTLEDIYNGKINYSNKVNIILTIDAFYTRSGIPFIREQLGTKDFSKSVEDQNKISKAIAAMFLYAKDDYKYTDEIRPLLKDPQPVVRGCAAASLSTIKDTDRYLPDLKHTFFNDKEYFVRYYALKGLGLNDYKTYKNEVLKVFNGNDFLGKIIAASVMLHNGDKTGLKTIEKGLNSPYEIANIRAIEALLLNNLLIEEKTIVMYFNSDNFLKNYLSARLLARNITPEYKSMLEENLKNKDFNKQFSASVALLEINDESGLNNIIIALDKEELILRIFAANAIIKHYDKTLETYND